MAYPVELEVKLSTKEAERKLNEMQAKAASKASFSGTSKGLNDISAGLKQLRAVIGAGAIAHSLADLAKQLELFGDKTDEAVSHMMSTFNNMTAAMSSGNPYVIAAVGAFEALKLVLLATVVAAKEEEAAMQKSLEAQMDRTRRWHSFRREADDYRESKEVDAAIESGDIAKIGPLLEKYTTRQQATQQTIDEMYSKGWHTSQVARMNGLISQAKDYDTIVEALQSAIRKKVKAEQDEAKAIADAELKKQQAEKQRIEDLEKAKESWNWSQRLKAYGSDASYLQNELMAAKEQMGGATTAKAFSTAASRATQLESALDALSREEQRKENESLQAQLQALTSVQSPVSNFTAAGFSMGEQFSTVDNISRHVEQIYWLLQQQLAQSLASYNIGTTTL